MTDEAKHTSARGSKLLVLGLLGVIVLSGTVWVVIESQLPVLSRETGRKFASAFEKECQSKHTEKFCLKVAGKHHSECFIHCASHGRDGKVDYSLDHYLTCMRLQSEKASKPHSARLAK